MSERWKPKNGEMYFYFDLNHFGDVSWKIWGIRNHIDHDLYQNGNCFRTRAEAIAAAEKVKALLLSLHDNRTSTANSETLKGTFIECLKKCAEIQADIILQKAKEHKLSEQCGNAPEETKLPDWCKVDTICWHKRCGYFTVTYIDDVSKRVDIQQVEDKSKGYLSFHTVCNEVVHARLRPWTAREAIGKVICWQGDYSFQENIATINAVDCDGDPMGDLIGNINLKDLTRECFYQPDGSPCGVLEHLNENGEWVK